MTVVIGVATGFVFGGAVSGAIVIAVLRTRLCPDSADHEFRDDEREQVASEFAVHATSVRRELGRYADALANGDVNLRQQLRQIETGVGSAGHSARPPCEGPQNGT